ncbi:glycosyl hydrolase family 61-domain-containing protein [Pseudomassariella vexata]|uniref:lytic cellulose monooxygenase (C4-dehydrogenating) n=1 Tax=Pseudomassariella vexata TaxID=1141098 RepID=A0A1Y2E0H6_9PEZI|nr:glycosyl hydrolase family 61-domain-containing protein [Pseudomassariella vexata]ORY65043.1 glycosyl hydrolase family 61-domain-containing protein [Pseudomassariella vexata]
MKQSVFMALAGPLAAMVDAHSIFSTLFVDDVSQGDATCVRMNPDSDQATAPVIDLASDDMACGFGGQTAVEYTCPASAGSKLTFEWRLYADGSQSGSIDANHKGPCAVYAKKVDNMATDSAAGAGWFKLWDEGYNEDTGKWCTENLIENNGLMSIVIPPGLPGGNYLFRPELLALHAVADLHQPQWYTGCAQIFVDSSNTEALEVPEEYSTSIPGYTTADNASLTLNIWTTFPLPYYVPGPHTYIVPSTYANTGGDALVQTEGVIPEDCLIKNGNWCGAEVSSYTTQDGCYSASEECYSQGQTCYDTAPPTGNKNCETWENKCKAIQDQCDAGNWNGPPDKGVKLTDAYPSITVAIPAALNADYYSGSDSDSSDNDSSDTQATAEASSLVGSSRAWETRVIPLLFLRGIS